MNASKKTNQSPILILADFSDGSWHAASFAMQFLYRQKSRLSILQTYEDPGWGCFMMRKLSHHLKKITKNELSALKRKLTAHFNIDKQSINAISYEGKLNDVLHYKTILKEDYILVLSTYSSFKDSCNRQNGCLKKIIDTAQNPLFILPGSFDDGVNKKILFVAHPQKNVSVALCKKVLEICQKTRSNLDVLFVLTSQDQQVPESVKQSFRELCDETAVSFSTIHDKKKCKGIDHYLNNSTPDLIVIEND